MSPAPASAVQATTDADTVRLNFERDGYVHIPNVLTQVEVAFLRRFFKEIFANPEQNFKGADYHEAIFEIFARWPECSFVLFKEPTLSILRALLGDQIALIRDSTVNINRHGWWWHKDVSNMERAGLKFHHDEDFRFVQVAYYLQDNTREFGGGLDIEVGSHKYPDPFKEAPGTHEVERSFIKRLLTADPRKSEVVPKYNDHFIQKPYSVPSKAGDLIIFDFWLNHRASQKRAKNLPPNQEKIAIFATFSKSNRHVRLMNEWVEGVYGNNLINFEYPDSVLEQARQAGLDIEHCNRATRLGST